MSGRLPSRADFNQLQHLMVLLEQRSVSRAAERLGMGQPAMSRVLARLRDQFDDPLLVRGPRGMMLTPRAEALRGPLRSWLREGEALIRDHGVDLGSMKRTFHLASTDFGVLSVIAPTLALIEREAGGVELVVEPLSDASLRRLEDGRLDFVLTGWNPHGSSLKSRWLFQETHLGLARSDHPVHACSRSSKDLLEWPHVSVSVGDGFGDWIAEDLPELADRRVLISAESFSLTPYLLAGTDAIAILPRKAAECFAVAHGLRTFPLPASIKPFDYHLVWHERSSDDQATQWVADTLARAFEAA
ncbi:MULTISPECIES: LysR family transcriptional regulator [unclassified Brevundimonas]|uniref:LysR family transcriptional regulator n=1 Tax=unclassified Brevundimonas TaxID=2622653 RepID=UPI0025B87E83|nr:MULTISPECIES: LysR family transcriptional regulator [unclassified Brevundimonas]